MGIIRTVLNTAVLGGAGSVAGFAFWTRNSKFVPVSSNEPLLSSPSYLRNNPNRNQPTHDLCIRRVPLKDIRADLLENEAKLTETFCAGVWSGLGYAYQRSFLEKKYRNTTTTAHQLWTKEELQSSTYDVGTQITDHFEVVSKTPSSIVVRCGDSPLKQEVRDSDGLFEIGVRIKKDEGVAEFRLQSLFYKGLGIADGKPMPSHIEFLHRLYTKLWMETAVANVRR